ncbi:MAG: GNAT family N-acetyltransferase [Pseudomonadota bacterium]
MSLSLTWHTDIADVAGAWRKIESFNNHSSASQSHAAARLWYDRFAKAGSVLVLGLYERDQCLGLYPLVATKKYGVRIPRTLFNGAPCFHSAPVVRAGRETEFAIGLLGALSAHFSRWDVLKIFYLSSYDPFARALTQVLPQAFGTNYILESKPLYCVDLNQAFDDYYRNALSAGTRKSLRRTNNRLEEVGCEYFFSHDFDALGLWKDFLALEESGWKGEQRKFALRRNPGVLSYYDEFVRILADYKGLLLGGLVMQNKLAAMSFGYFDKNIYHDHRTAYDETFKAYSPSTMLSLALTRYLMSRDGKPTIMNQSFGDFGYKHRFAHARYSADTYRIISPNSKMRYLFSAYRRRISFTNWVKKIAARQGSQPARPGASA